MRALALAFALAAMAATSGCASYLQSMYDNEAIDNCQDGPRRVGAESCYERVDRESRARRRDD